jgi:hypothetical protein
LIVVPPTANEIYVPTWIGILGTVICCDVTCGSFIWPITVTPFTEFSDTESLAHTCALRW